MSKPITLVLLLSISLTVGAQQYSSTNIGKVATFNNVDVTVTVDSTGTLILSTSSHSVYLDRSVVVSFGNALDAILAGMRDLETKDITLVDYRDIGEITQDGSHDNTADGIMFRFELNPTKDNKVLLLIHSTVDMEDMIFTSKALAQLDDIVKKALKSGSDYSDQYAYIQSVIDKIDTTAFK